jgi:hypothetical protein
VGVAQRSQESYRRTETNDDRRHLSHCCEPGQSPAQPSRVWRGLRKTSRELLRAHWARKDHVTCRVLVIHGFSNQNCYILGMQRVIDTREGSRVCHGDRNTPRRSVVVWGMERMGTSDLLLRRLPTVYRAALCVVIRLHTAAITVLVPRAVQQDPHRMGNDRAENADGERFHTSRIGKSVRERKIREKGHRDEPHV